jgi:hypothetical protein
MVAVAVVFVLAVSAKAQNVAGFQPGKTITISITFDGPDAEKITSVIVNFLIPAAPKDQAGYVTEMSSNPSQSKKISPNTFQVSFPVLDVQASGEYHLNYILAYANVGSSPIAIRYNVPEAPDTTIKIANSGTFAKPSVKDVKVLP